MHIVLKIIIVLILLYLFDKYGVQAWMDYPKILIREPISMKSSLNYTKDINFKVGRPEKGINWSMSFWMYIKDLHYREGRKKIIMKTPAFEMYLHENKDKLVIKVPFYKMPCTNNRCPGNECDKNDFFENNNVTETADLSTKNKLMSDKEAVNEALKKYEKSIIDLRKANENFKKQTVIVGNSTSSVINQPPQDYNSPKMAEVIKTSQNENLYKCGPIKTDSQFDHYKCSSDTAQYCNHLSGYCSNDESTKQISLAAGGIYNLNFDEVNPGKGIPSYYDAYKKLIEALEYNKTARHDYDNAKKAYKLSKKSSVGYSIIEFKDIPIQRWINVVLLVNNRHIDLWVNNKLIESRYLPNIPVLSNLTFDSVSCRDGFNGYISALTVWDHLITRNMIYYLTTNSPVSKSLYDKTIGFFVKSIDDLINYIEKNFVKITITAPKSNSLPKKIKDEDSCK